MFVKFEQKRNIAGIGITCTISNNKYNNSIIYYTTGIWQMIKWIQREVMQKINEIKLNGSISGFELLFWWLTNQNVRQSNMATNKISAWRKLLQSFFIFWPIFQPFYSLFSKLLNITCISCNYNILCALCMHKEYSMHKKM